MGEEREGRKEGDGGSRKEIVQKKLTLKRTKTKGETRKKRREREE